MSTIKPTIGRKVYFYDPAPDPHAPGVVPKRYDEKQPFDATVIYVWGDTCVNLRVTDHAGNSWVRTSVPLRDPAEGDQHGVEYVATWMPFQVGQARNAGAAVTPKD